MKLSHNLRAVIVQSFLAGQGLHFMADLYKQPYQKVEDVIRRALALKPDKPVVDDAGGALGEEK